LADVFVSRESAFMALYIATLVNGFHARRPIL
jgi:hypothetical protein